MRRKICRNARIPKITNFGFGCRITCPKYMLEYRYMLEKSAQGCQCFLLVRVKWQALKRSFIFEVTVAQASNVKLAG